MSKTAKKATMTVTKQFYSGKRLTSEDESQETLDVLVFEHDQVSTTSVKLGLTVNLGNFESARADVMATVPHYEEERDDAFLYALKEVEQKIQLVFGDKTAAQDLVSRARRAMKK